MPSTNHLVKNQYIIYKQHANFQDPTFTQSEALGFYNWEKGVEVRMWENAHEKKRKKSTLLDVKPLGIWQIMHVKDTMHAK